MQPILIWSIWEVVRNLILNPQQSVEKIPLEKTAVHSFGRRNMLRVILGTFWYLLVLSCTCWYLLEILCTFLYWHRIAQFWPWKDGESYWGWEAECQDNVHLSSRWASQLTKVTKMWQNRDRNGTQSSTVLTKVLIRLILWYVPDASIDVIQTCQKLFPLRARRGQGGRSASEANLLAAEVNPGGDHEWWPACYIMIIMTVMMMTTRPTMMGRTTTTEA